MDNLTGKTVLVTTTIRVPIFLEGVCENAIRYGHRDVACLVIGDVKTPPETRQFCRGLTERFGVPVLYLDVSDQERAFADHTELLKFIPKNSTSRILLGNLLVYQSGCERLIIMLDDDFVTDIDFFGSHRIAGETREINLIETPSGWYNVHELAIEERGIPFYARGYPWSKRTPQPQERIIRRHSARIVVNQGLLLEDPDVDALTRLFWPIRATGMDTHLGEHVGLAPGTWCPFNIDDTAFARELIPVYCLVPSLARNDDIWASYLITRLAEHRGEVISYGYPLVKQLRNPQSLWANLAGEVVNNRATDHFVTLIRSVPLSGDSYAALLDELLDQCQERLHEMRDLPLDEAEMMEWFFNDYRTWQRLVPAVVSSSAASPSLYTKHLRTVS